MGFWAGWATFFSTPNEWIPVVVSVVALVVAIFTATQTWRYYPRPRLSVAKTGGETLPQFMLDGERKPLPHATTIGQSIQVNITNFGNGAAHDVRFGSGWNFDRWTPLGTLAPNAVLGAKGSATWKAGDTPAVFLVTWMQYPGPHRWLLDAERGEPFRYRRNARARRLARGALAPVRKGLLRLRR